jgi:hypothetical protein
MDPETVTTLVQTAGGAAGALKTILETITAARGQVKSNKEADAKLSEAIDLAIDLRSRLVDLQEKAFRLQKELDDLHAENVKLREDIRREKEGTTERQKYQLKKAGGSTVYVREDQPGVYYCTTCGAKGHWIPLQPESIKVLGTHSCGQCHTLYRL